MACTSTGIAPVAGAAPPPAAPPTPGVLGAQPAQRTTARSGAFMGGPGGSGPRGGAPLPGSAPG
ncbi:MAG: hypothetical protein ACK559_26405 [bacterium]